MVRGDASRNGPDFAQIRVNLVNKHDRSVGSHAIAQQLYAALAPVRAGVPGDADQDPRIAARARRSAHR